jgi:hypothetical protein
MIRQQAVPEQAARREVLEKLAEFRSGLDETKHRMVDSIVVRALGEGGDGAAGPDAHAPVDEQDVNELAEALERFEATLPADQRELLEALLAKGSHEESEVEGHIYAAWTVSDWTWNYGVYSTACQMGGGIGVTASPYWWNPSYSQFTCWRW